MQKFNFDNGELLLVDKTLHWTSFDIVNKIRSTLKPAKIKVGHAGTLDPLATGLLIVCTGKMTKKIHNFQDQKKTYIGTMALGATTPSFDNGTEINATFNYKNITKDQIIQHSMRFVGEIQQIPPIYSALKVGGERLYNKARRGEFITVPPRIVTIYNFEILDINIPEIQFLVECSKGTYIRSLANDLGKSLNSGAYLTSLRRTKIGDYSVENAFKIEEFPTLFNFL